MTYTDQEVPDGAESVAISGILEIKQLSGQALACGESLCNSIAPCRKVWSFLF